MRWATSLVLISSSWPEVATCDPEDDEGGLATGRQHRPVGLSVARVVQAVEVRHHGRGRGAQAAGQVLVAAGQHGSVVRVEVGAEHLVGAAGAHSWAGSAARCEPPSPLPSGVAANGDRLWPMPGISL